MISIFIYEQDKQQADKIHTILSNYIMIENLDSRIKFVTNNPHKIINYVKQQHYICSIYFINLSSEGIELAQKIRKMDVLGKIIFLGYQEFPLQIIESRCEALYYILNSDSLFKEKLIHSLNLALSRLTMSQMYHSERFLTIKQGHYITTIALNDIVYFECSTTPHKVIAHLVDKDIEFYHLMKDLEMENKGLYRCHRSYIVNVYHISSINKKDKSITMKNGDICYYSDKYRKNLLENMMA